MKLNYTFPPMEEYIMPNGMRMIWLPDSTHPVMMVTLLIPVGRYNDPPALEGTAELTASLMLKGPKSLSSEAFAEKIEHAGVALYADVKEEYTVIGARMLHKSADAIIPLFWEIISDPALDKKEFARLKKEMITGINAEFSDPSTLAGRHFYAELFGASHPAGRNHTLDSIKRITHEKIQTFYNATIAPAQCTLCVAGAGTVTDMKKRWESLFSGWHASVDARAHTLCTGRHVTENRVRIIDKPEFSQTTVLLGHQSVHEGHDNRIPLAVANHILGGGNFSSRLMARIRSETGQTYGIASQLNSMKDFGVFTIGTSTQNNQLQGVIDAISDVYTIFVTDGATESEITKAKQFAAGNMAFELEGLNNIVEKILWLRFYERENSYIESFDSFLAPIDSATIKSALHNDFASRHFIIVAVGRQAEIVEQLEKYGNPRLYKCRDNPLKN